MLPIAQSQDDSNSTPWHVNTLSYHSHEHSFQHYVEVPLWRR
jgi:hypothetical protein